MSDFDFLEFGSEEHIAKLKELEKREQPFRAGETHRLSLEFSIGDAPTAKIECLELADPERACSVRNYERKPIPDTCILQDLYANVGWDAVSIAGQESAILKLDLPVGYDCEGSGEDYEDWFVLHLPAPES